MYVHHWRSAHWGQEGLSDSHELELKMVVSHQDGVGNQIWVVCKSRKILTAKLFLSPLFLQFLNLHVPLSVYT